ncbi:hypothetical protein ABZZ74_45315 [Streptomyces sp. NPDC006476]|uniref:hypothetical protein n=1 Tax=Streptomyces sp. NPDC006476 TaxID=3157175 RepID=UPI0033A5C8A9
MAAASWDRSRRIAAAASVLAVIVALVCAVVLVLGAGVPEAWWPHTGQAFAAGTRTVHQDPCALIVGPAKGYCERGATTTATAREKQDVASAAWMLWTAGSGVAALMVWRLRGARGQRRR